MVLDSERSKNLSRANEHHKKPQDHTLWVEAIQLPKAQARQIVECLSQGQCRPLSQRPEVSLKATAVPSI